MIPLDDISRRILVQLQHDGRRSYAAIGKEIGLSEAAVRQRVQRMTESGAMRIVAVADPAALGLAWQATIAVRVDGPLEPIAETLTKIDRVTSIVLTAGSADLLAGVACASDQEFLGVIEQIRTLDHVVGTESFVFLREAKPASG